MRSFPKIALLVEAGEMPLNIRRQYLSHMFVLKLISCPGFLTTTKLIRLNGLIQDRPRSFWSHRPLPDLIMILRYLEENV